MLASRNLISPHTAWVLGHSCILRSSELPSKLKFKVWFGGCTLLHTLRTPLQRAMKNFMVGNSTSQTPPGKVELPN